MCHRNRLSLNSLAPKIIFQTFQSQFSSGNPQNEQLSTRILESHVKYPSLQKAQVSKKSLKNYEFRVHIRNLQGKRLKFFPQKDSFFILVNFQGDQVSPQINSKNEENVIRELN